MSEPPAIRASDADRERAVELLRDHAAEGRLTLEELADRVSTAYRARTGDELERLTRDLPAERARSSRRRPTRFLLSVFGSTEREGRIRVRRRVACLTAFGNIDLDLRRATLEGDVITIVALGMFGAVDVYVPEGDRKSTRLNSSHRCISYAVFCLKKKTENHAVRPSK